MARLVVVSGNAEAPQFEVGQGVTIGREGHNDIPLPKARGVSRDHAKFWRQGHAKYAVADLGSTNGVMLNNVRVPRADVVEGDEIQIGDVTFRFELGDDEKPKPKVEAKTDSSREDFAAILRGEKQRDDKPVAAELEGHAAIQIKERILQYNKKTSSSNQLNWDMSQTGGATGTLLKVGAVVVIGALFWLAMQIFG